LGLYTPRITTIRLKFKVLLYIRNKYFSESTESNVDSTESLESVADLDSDEMGVMAERNPEQMVNLIKIGFTILFIPSFEIIRYMTMQNSC